MCVFVDVCMRSCTTWTLKQCSKHCCHRNTAYWWFSVSVWSCYDKCFRNADWVSSLLCAEETPVCKAFELFYVRTKHLVGWDFRHSTSGLTEMYAYEIYFGGTHDSYWCEFLLSQITDFSYFGYQNLWRAFFTFVVILQTEQLINVVFKTMLPLLWWSPDLCISLYRASAVRPVLKSDKLI